MFSILAKEGTIKKIRNIVKNEFQQEKSNKVVEIEQIDEVSVNLNLFMDDSSSSRIGFLSF